MHYIITMIVKGQVENKLEEKNIYTGKGKTKAGDEFNQHKKN